MARPEAINYDSARFPGTYRALDQMLVLPWNERYTQNHLEFLAASVREAVYCLT